MKKTLERYNENLKVGEYETLMVEKNMESGQIRIEIFEERWRMPDETIKMLKEVIEKISSNF